MMYVHHSSVHTGKCTPPCHSRPAVHLPRRGAVVCSSLESSREPSLLIPGGSSPNIRPDQGPPKKLVWDGMRSLTNLTDCLVAPLSSLIAHIFLCALSGAAW